MRTEEATISARPAQLAATIVHLVNSLPVDWGVVYDILREEEPYLQIAVRTPEDLPHGDATTIAGSAIAEIEAHDVPAGARVTLSCHYEVYWSAALRWWGVLLDHLRAEGWRVQAEGDLGTQKRGPTEKTRLRAEVFKEIKDRRPDLGYDAVADHARRACPDLGDGITGETVRNAYRSMGWPWERADRIR